MTEQQLIDRAPEIPAQGRPELAQEAPPPKSAPEPLARPLTPERAARALGLDGAGMPATVEEPPASKKQPRALPEAAERLSTLAADRRLVLLRVPAARIERRQWNPLRWIGFVYRECRQEFAFRIGPVAYASPAALRRFGRADALLEDEIFLALPEFFQPKKEAAPDVPKAVDALMAGKFKGITGAIEALRETVLITLARGAQYQQRGGGQDSGKKDIKQDNNGGKRAAND